MSEDRGSITLEGERTTIAFRRTIRHPIDRVWRAITDPEELSTWMLESATIEPWQGGRIEYVSSPSPIVWYGRILVWDPPRVYEHEFNTDADPRWEEHLGEERAVARWELEEGEGFTLLKLTFRGLSKNTAGGFAPGTHAFLDRLAAHLAGRALPEWSRRFEHLMPLYRTG